MLQPGESIKSRFKQHVSRSLIIILLCSSFPLLSYSQVFPLKTGNDHFLTKRQEPFLLNAGSAKFQSNIEDINKSLSRLNFQRINTVIVAPGFGDFPFENGIRNRVLQQKINALIRLTRQADLKNMAVMIFTDELLLPFPKEERDQYLTLLFKKLHRFTNVMWVLDKDDLTELTGSRINSKQLKGVVWNEDIERADFRIVSEIESLNGKHVKPVFFRIAEGTNINDSTMHLQRRKVCTAILKGASGILVMPEKMKNNEYPGTNLLAGQVKLLKSVFDTCQWFSLKEAPFLVRGINDLSEMPVISTVSPDSSAAVLYLPSAQTFPLDISFFGNRVKLTWIDALTGEVHHSAANGKPDIQLFIPPLSDNKYTDWLLIIRRAEKHSARTGF